MAVNRLVIEYPRGLDLNIAFFNAEGQMVNTVAMAPPLLLRLGPNLEFESATSGNILKLLDDTDTDESDEDSAMDTDSNPMTDETIDLEADETIDLEADATIDLVTSDDDDDNDDEADDSNNDDMIILSHPIDA